jgi:hypothetical protein
VTAGAHRAHRASPVEMICGEPIGTDGFVCTRMLGHGGRHLEPLTREVLARPDVWRTHTTDDWAWPRFANAVCVVVMLLMAAGILGCLWKAGLLPW